MDCTGRCFVRPLSTGVAWTVAVGVSLDLSTPGLARTVPVGVLLDLSHQVWHGHIGRCFVRPLYTRRGMDCTGRCFVRPLSPGVAWTLPVDVSFKTSPDTRCGMDCTGRCFV